MEQDFNSWYEPMYVTVCQDIELKKLSCLFSNNMETLHFPHKWLALYQDNRKKEIKKTSIISFNKHPQNAMYSKSKTFKRPGRFAVDSWITFCIYFLFSKLISLSALILLKLNFGLKYQCHALRYYFQI